VFWVISVYFNIRNTLPKFCPFLLGHPVYIFPCILDIYVCMYIYIYRVQNAFLRCTTPRLHCFLSFHWPLFRFLSFMAFIIDSIQFFFGLRRALFCFGIHFNASLGNLPFTILLYLLDTYRHLTFKSVPTIPR